MEPTTEQATREFFEAHERSSAAGDAEALARLYAASFLVAGPNGAQVVKSCDLLHAIPKRKQILEAAGCTSARLTALHETKLDDRYSLVRTEWRWQLHQIGEAPPEVTLSSTFIVQQSSEGLRIVLYLPHGDIMAVLRERGLLQAS